MQSKELKARAHKLAPVVISSARRGALRDICARVGAQPVQSIGKVLVIYREKKN